MQSYFNSLQKPYRMSERKCLVVFLMDNKCYLAQCVQIFFRPLIWWKKCQFCAFNEAQITCMWIQLHGPLYMYYARTRVGDTLK